MSLNGCSHVLRFLIVVQIVCWSNVDIQGFAVLPNHSVDRCKFVVVVAGDLVVLRFVLFVRRAVVVLVVLFSQ